MRAVLVTEFGPPEVLVATEVPDPVAGARQVVIDDAFANITFVETQIRAGRPPNPAMLPELPWIPGNGVGGVVVAVGAWVDPNLVGGRVITSTNASGAYAEQVAVAAEGLVAVPDGLGMAEAVALLADGRTALSLARSAGREEGWHDRVLAEHNDGVDVAFDGVGGEIGRASFDLVRDGGRFVPIGMASGAFTAIRGGGLALRACASTGRRRPRRKRC